MTKTMLINQKIASWLGWKRIRHGSGAGAWSEWKLPDGTEILNDEPFTTLLDCVALAEMEIHRKGLIKEYIGYLGAQDAERAKYGMEFDYLNAWAFAVATAQERCNAIVKVIEGEGVWHEWSN